METGGTGAEDGTVGRGAKARGIQSMVIAVTEVRTGPTDTVRDGNTAGGVTAILMTTGTAGGASIIDGANIAGGATMIKA